MSDFINRELLKKTLEPFEIELSAQQLDRFDLFARLLTEQNEKINLTAITEPDEIAVKHFADCLILLRYVDIPLGAAVADIGTGAGFPGIPLLIARPDLKMTLLDGTQKKIRAVSEMLGELGLTATALWGRAEQVGKTAEHRGKYDFAVTRAVASVERLLKYCLPFIKPDGALIAMKGQRAQQEIDEAKAALRRAGARVDAVFTFELENAGERRLVVVRR